MLALLLQLATSPVFDLGAVPRPVPAISGCGRGGGEEVIVCARDASRHRLPLPVEPDPDARTGGPPASAVAAITPAARCGIFAGERRCGRAEAARYGYGEGHDPVTFLGKLASAIADPD